MAREPRQREREREREREESEFTDKLVHINRVAKVIEGVTKGYERKLEINGVGYRAALQGKNLQLQLGYAHDIVYPIPEGITIAVPKPTEIVITGIDAQKVGQAAAEIRAFRKPEPSKGKGVKYSDEFIFRKEGKKK